MKRIFTLLLAVASLTVVSCQKEQETKIDTKPDKGLVKVTVLAHSPEVKGDTKTSLADNGSLYWSYGDHICVYDGYGLRDFASDIQQEAEPTKVTTFDGEIQSGATNFKAVYPYSEGVSYSEGNFVTAIPATQYAVEGSFANQANVAVATGTSGQEVDTDEDYALAQFVFSNVGALVKFTISQDGVHKGVTIKAFTKAEEVKTYAQIAGEIQINPATAEATTTTNSVDAVSVEAESGYLAAGDYYAVILPIEGQNLSFTFTDGNSTKTRNAKSAVSIGRSTYYDMGTIDTGITYPDPFEGEWVIAGIDTNPYVLSEYVDGNVYPAVQAVSIENGVVTVVGSKASYKVTIAKETEGDYEGMYTIKDAGNLYLTATGANSNNYMKGFAENARTAGSYWAISEESEGIFAIEATQYSGNRNQIRVNHNNGNPRFTCYQNTNTTQPKVCLYPFADVVESLVPTANPSISCSDNTITITCSTEGATIYYTIGENEASTADPTNTSSVYNADNKPTIEADSYVKAFAIADGYAASSIVGKAVNYEDPGTDTYYEKVTSALSDWSGDYLIVCESESLALSSISTTSTKYGIGAEVTISNSKIVSNSTTNGYKIVIASATGDGSGYTLKFGDNYLYWGSGNSLATNASETNNSRWTITAGATSGNWVIANVGQASRQIWYNTSSPRFACYENKTETTDGYAPVQLYKLKDNDTRQEAGMSWSPESATATYNTGNILSFTAPALTLGNATGITYKSTDENIATIAANGSVTITALSGNVVTEGSTTIKAIFAGNDDYKPQTVSYTLHVVDNRSSVATPTFSPAAGEVAPNTTVNFQCTDSPVTYYYTLNGSTPTTASTQGSSVTIDMTRTVKVIATKTGYKPSAVAEASYTIAGVSTTIADVISGGVDTYEVPDVLVYAVKGNGLILGDGTGFIYAYKSGHGLSAGDVRTVNGTTQLYQNEVYQFNAPTFSGSGTSTVDHGTAVEFNDDADDLETSFTAAGNLHTAVYVHATGTQSSRSITTAGGKVLYLSANETATDGMAVEVYGYVYAYSSSHTNFNFLVTSIEIDQSVPTLTTTPASGSTLTWADDEYGAGNAKTITVTQNGAATGYTVSSASAAWTVSDNGTGTITVYPNAANESTTDDKTLDVTITHKDNGALTSTITLKQTKQSGGGGTLTIDFESASSSYTDWTFSNVQTRQTNVNVTAHGGSYFGNTTNSNGSGVSSNCHITTVNKITSPSSITFYISKQSTNETASTWTVKVSSDGSSWTTVGATQSAGNGVTRGTWYEVTRNLSSYSNVYVRIEYSGSTAIRDIDDVTLSYN